MKLRLALFLALLSSTGCGNGDVPTPAGSDFVRIEGEVDPKRPRPVPESDAPDVLMICLDALRADHVGAWGYERDTTPTLDRLAAEGVALTRMFSEAPYTRNSIATVFTGFSWRDHGVLTGEHALDLAFVTLAEVLFEAGWSTYAISDNSNVARSAGSDQGFEEFVQAWSDLDLERDPDAPKWWPEKPVVAWEQRLRTGFDPARPVFAYLHLIPPHEPYFPGPDHDVFGPDGYAGPVTGRTRDMRALERGELDGDDHDRLVALYDGALRRGDALVDRVLRAWNALDRDRPTMVIVFSDHGEGFGEHGRYGHNTTVHDPMNHVPVILHPVDLVPTSVVARADALRSLGDLLPLMLASLDVRLPVGSEWPRRVLEVLHDPASPRSEIFLRTNVERYGLRTDDHVWVFEEGEAERFFDLQTDPAAQIDLRGAQPQRWEEGLARIRAFLSRGYADGGAVPAEPTPEDLERLRALGYVDGR